MTKDTNNQTAENLSFIANLTWKELETIYYLGVPSLKDYAGNLPDLFKGKDTKSKLDSVEKETRTSTLQEEVKNEISTPSTSSTAIDGITAHKQEHISTSPFAKLKSSVSAVIQASFSQPIKPKPLDTALKKQQPLSQPAVEEAWFVEPAQNSKTELAQKKPAQPLKTSSEQVIPLTAHPVAIDPVVINSAVIESVVAEPVVVKPAVSEPVVSEPAVSEPAVSEPAVSEPAVVDQAPKLKSEPLIANDPEQPLSLDMEIENAFGRMLQPAKKGASRSAPQASPAPPATALNKSLDSTESQSAQSLPVSDDEKGWMPVFGQTAPSNTSPPSDPENTYTSLFEKTSAAFDFSAAEGSTENQSSQSSVLDKDTETGECEPVNVPEIKAPGDKAADSKDREGEAVDDLIVSSDALRDLIQSHIKHAAGQVSDGGQGQSIGTGKEFEVWLNNPARSKFVGASKTNESNQIAAKNPGNFKPRIVPADIRKSCLILGIRPENITYESVQECWKKAIALPGVHPDQGGDTEMAVYLNTAKDVLIRWLDAQAPKLGKKFGPSKKE